MDLPQAYKLIEDTFTEEEVCDLSEINLFPDQYLVGLVAKNSTLQTILNYG